LGHYDGDVGGARPDNSAHFIRTLMMQIGTDDLGPGPECRTSIVLHAAPPHRLHLAGSSVCGDLLCQGRFPDTGSAAEQYEMPVTVDDIIQRYAQQLEFFVAPDEDVAACG